jgi:5'-nucleotidase
MQYDAVTIGNHETDFSPVGLEMLVNNALASSGGFDVPLLASNMVTDATDDGDDGVEALIAAGVITDRLVLDLPNGIRVGVLGVVGNDADGAAPLAPPLRFDHSPERMQALVKYLKDQEGVHVVLVVSHGGIHSDGGGDDITLAVDVPDIDVILPGHYHEITPVANTDTSAIIYIPGEYTKWISRLDARVDLTARQIVDFNFELIHIDDSITGDASMQAVVDTYDASLDALLQGAIGWNLGDPMIEVPFDMEREDYDESGICNLCADAFRTLASLLAGGSGDPTPHYDVAIFPSGAARDGLYNCACGYNTMADVFNVIPLGISPDENNQDNLGWPLVEIFLTPAELKLAAEMSVSIARRFRMDTVFICFSGIRVEYNPTGPPMPPDRVRRLWLCKNGTPPFFGGDADYYSSDCTTELDLNDTTTLLRVVTDMYTAMLVTAVQDVGLEIRPKFSDGTEINVDDLDELMTTRIDLDPGPDVLEWKPWMALASYLRLPFVMQDATGLPGVNEMSPAYDVGGEAMGRFIEVSD